MQAFRVLDRDQNIHKNYLLEASAGTGKTFSIENIVVRLLIENNPLTIEQILIVTFTRAATRDLKLRIHGSILSAVDFLRNAKNGLSNYTSSTIDYLSKIVEEGIDSINMALRNLERAVCSFDLSQIYTIHGFCAQMLSENIFESNFTLAVKDNDDSVSSQRLRAVIRDFFRGGSPSNNYSKAQLKHVLKMFSGDLNRLEKALLGVVSKGIDIEKSSDFKSQLITFNETMRVLKNDNHFSSSKIMDDFIILAPQYKGNCDRQGNIKKEIIEKIHDFSKLFDKESWDIRDLDWLIEDQLSILKALDIANMKVKATYLNDDSLQIPDLRNIIEKHLLEYVSVNNIFSRMAYDCQIVLNKYKNDHECFGYDDFLITMKNSLSNPEFQAKVSSRYKAAIIDEFQDTDPLQWEIFQKLFLSRELSETFLYLVGDPKQSIYAFRQADIYTYLLAAERIGESNHYSLDTNYRSQPLLVHALNTLFSENACPGMLYLPKNCTSMKYPIVKSPDDAVETRFSDDRGTVHFFVAEDKNAKRYPLENLESEYFFPFISNEIQELISRESLTFNQFAILVSDRYQAARMADHLNSRNIPASLQRASSLVDTDAFPSMRELLVAVLNPKDESALKIALGGKIIRWNHNEIQELEDPANLENVLYKLFSLRESLCFNGFPTFFQNFLNSTWKTDSYTVIERLLLEDNGEEFLHDLQQIADLLLQQGNLSVDSPSSLIKYLDEMFSIADSDDETAKKIKDPTKNAVQIMTLHASKGLEFDIVFTLGLAKRTKVNDSLIPVEKNQKRYLTPVIDKNSTSYKSYCQELDSEKIRQLYVAMTRAKYRLYNPVVFAPSSGKVDVGCASPMDLYLARLGREPIDQSNIYQRINSYDLRSFIDFVGSVQDSASITYSVLNQISIPDLRYNTKEVTAITPPPQIIIPGHDRFIHSFTSLSTSQHKFKKQNNLEAPHDFAEINKTPHTLPAGSETGNLLHKCLENISFEMCKQLKVSSDIESIIKPYILGTEYEGWMPVICDIIFNAVKAPLKGGFSLTDVSSENIWKEGEFIYKSTLSSSPGYIKGFVDLFFFYNNKYYLLDWKSNWLGPDNENYDAQTLKLVMEENDYFLQSKLYCEAIRKYLSLVDARPFKDIFGGVFYIFLRGLDLKSDTGYGVFHFNAEE